LSEERLEAISASFSISEHIPQGVILIQGLKGDTITHLLSYSESLTAEEVAEKFWSLPPYYNQANEFFSRTEVLRGGLAKFDQPDKNIVVSFDSRISYGMVGWSPPAYERQEVFEEMPPNHQGPRPRRRSSLSVVQSNNFQIFLRDSDMMGVVPVAAKDGDVICHSLNCDAAVVMRHRGKNAFSLDEPLSFRERGPAPLA
jgi:hypothetical protein